MGQRTPRLLALNPNNHTTDITTTTAAPCRNFSYATEELLISLPPQNTTNMVRPQLSPPREAYITPLPASKTKCLLRKSGLANMPSDASHADFECLDRPIH